MPALSSVNQRCTSANCCIRFIISAIIVVPTLLLRLRLVILLPRASLLGNLLVLNSHIVGSAVVTAAAVVPPSISCATAVVAVVLPIVI